MNFGELIVKQRLEFKAYKVDKELKYKKLADWGLHLCMVRRENKTAN